MAMNVSTSPSSSILTAAFLRDTSSLRSSNTPLHWGALAALLLVEMFMNRFLTPPARSTLRRSVQRFFSSSPAAVNPFYYQELFDLSHDNTPYRKVTDKYVNVIEV